MSSSGADAELKFVHTFVAANRRERWLDGLQRPKARPKLLNRLCHLDDWVPGTGQQLELTGKRDAKLSLIRDALQVRGAPLECQVVALDSDLDGKRLTLMDALDRTVGYGCAVLICLPNRLALHLPEAPELPVILSRSL